MGVSFLHKRDAEKFATKRKRGFRSLMSGSPKRKAFLKKSIKSVKIKKRTSKKHKKPIFEVVGN